MASKPVLFAVDDDPEVLRGVECNLRRKYDRSRNGGAYRIPRADSATTAMDTLGKLELRGDPGALFLVDQRMPRTTGVEFLEEAREPYPEAKKVLLTAYADMGAAIKAVSDIELGYYLQKPWDQLRRTSTLYSAAGAPPTGPPSRVPGWWATPGRHAPVR